MLDGFVGSNHGNNDPVIVNSYSNGNIIGGSYSGGIMGAHYWRSSGVAGTGINSYYLKSDTVTGSVGKRNEGVEEMIASTGIDVLTQEIIDSLNEYIENDADGLGTSQWKKWSLDENGNPKFIE